MKLNVYDSNLGLFIQQAEYPRYSNPRINGCDITFNRDASDWLLLRDTFEIKSFEVLKKGQPKHVGYTLKISSIANDEIPLNLPLEDVGLYYDEDAEESRWKSYADYQALYKPVHEPTPDVWEALPIEMHIIRKIQIDNYENPVQMKLSTMVQQQVTYTTSDDLAHVVCYEDIERILTPAFLLHERPCKLTSDQVYKIVRNHVKNNINSSVASITSDYDFCFTVKRKISIKPITTKTEVKKQSGRSYATPKFNYRTVTHKEVEIFQMAPKPYQSYTTIQGWEASNLKEMAEQVKYYLETLMDEINAPVVECQHCAGQGAIVQMIGTNVREKA